MNILQRQSLHPPGTPTATGIAIEHGRVLALAEAADPGGKHFLSQFQVGRKEIHAYNCEGRAVIPGLTDAHIHLEHYALGLEKVDCETKTRAECLRRVAERARNAPPGEWILGHGWNQNEWPEGFGSAADLDAAAPEHPVYLTAKSLHAAWANTTALRLASISCQSQDPRRAHPARSERRPDRHPLRNGDGAGRHTSA
jgi:predicted amidohydrolase YtcJ